MARQVGGAAARVEYVLFSATRTLLKSLPLRRAAALGAALGSTAAMLDRFNRPVAMRNLEIAFPEHDRAWRLATLAAMYRNWGRSAAEWCHQGDLTAANIAEFVTYDGLENWRIGEQLSAGRGGIILTGHFGNFELMAAAHALYGHRVAIVYRPLRNRFIAGDVDAWRTALGNSVIARKGAARRIVELLKISRHVVIPIDLDVRRGVFVNFFSLPACTTDSLARLAMTTGAPVAPVFMVREGESLHHRIVILPIIPVEAGADRELSVREYTQQFSTIFEDMVRRHPDHWNWIHRRWKTRPRGEKRFY